MKQTLLFGLLTLSFYNHAQMTQANEPSIGTLNSMYLCDSFAVNFDGITGVGVTWDYDDIAGYDSEVRDVEAVDPSGTTYSSDFPGATYAIKIGSNLVTYYSSTATERSSQGFVFSEAGLGDVIAKFDTDEEIVVTYPFSYGSTSDDSFAGNIDYLAAFSTSASGMGHAQIDGTGTLQLAGNTLNNVMRYKLVDTSWATITFPINLGDVEFIRRQYEYYDYTVSTLPVLLHSNITIQNVGATTPISSQSIVLSYYAPQFFMGVNEVSGIDFSVYPNPSKNEIMINGLLSQNAIVEILDQGGRVLKSTSDTKISIADLAEGMYIVRVNDQGTASSTRIIKQ